MTWRAIGPCMALAGIPALACEGVDPRDPRVLNRDVDGGLGGSTPGGSGGGDAAGASGAGSGEGGSGGGGSGGGGSGRGGTGSGGSGGTCVSGTKSCGGDVCIPDGDCCETCGPFEQCGSDGSCSCIEGAFGTGCTGRFFELLPVGAADQDSEATAVSGNGRVVVGWSGALGVSPPTQRAASWEWEAGLSADLGTLTIDQPANPSSVATAVNENGAIVVGVSSLVVTAVTGEVPVRWVNGSLLRLELGEGSIFGRAEAVSGNGTAAAGWMTSDGGAFVGAVWIDGELDGSSPYTSSPDSVRFFAFGGTDAFGERAFAPVDAASGGGMRTIPSGGLSGFVSAASSGGQFLAGTLDGNQPVRWVGIGAGEPELLAGPGEAEDVANDGTVVGTSGGTAVLWTTTGQRREVLDILVEANATGISGWTFSSARGISDDARVIVGAGTFGGRSRGWVARLPAAE